MTAPALPVPYATAYTDEELLLDVAFVPDVWAVSGVRLSYLTPGEDDHDLGVLWARQAPHRDPKARIRYDEFHTRRQKRCMQGRLCQVCEGPAMDTEGRMPWVFHRPVQATQGRLSKPPTCRSCIADVLGACPYLQRDAHIYTSPDYDLWGVRGIVFSPLQEPPARAEVPFSDVYTLELTLARGLTARVCDLQPERRS